MNFSLNSCVYLMEQIKPVENMNIYQTLCCSCSVAKSWPTLCNPMHCSMPGSSVLYQLLEFAQIHVHWVNDAIQLSHPLLPTFPVSFTTSQLGVFSNNLAVCIRWPKYWSFSFSFSISPSNEHSRLSSFRIDWLDLLAVQGTLKSLLQHHRSKASILQCSAFFIVQLSDPYMTTGKPQLWLYGPFSAEWYCCFETCCLGLL